MTTGEKLLNYSTLASGASALEHFRNIKTWGTMTIMNSIDGDIIEDKIQANIYEDLLDADIHEDNLQASILDERVDSNIKTDNIIGDIR